MIDSDLLLKKIRSIVALLVNSVFFFIIIHVKYTPIFINPIVSCIQVF